MNIFKEFFRNPYLDWLAVLIITAVLFITLAFMGLSLYNAVTEGKIVGTAPKSATFTKPDEQIISAVVDLFEKREETSAKARAGYTGQPDPSI
jgi:hypothetical protein